MNESEVTMYKMYKAFALVTPEKFGAKDWREPIKASVSKEALDERGLTIADLARAIVFFTATQPEIEVSSDGGIVYHVSAKGYRAGPAGP